MPHLRYDASRQSLIHPGAAEDFFQLGPADTDAVLCAEMSRLAYVTQTDRLARYLERAGFRVIRALGYDQIGLQAFVATHAARHICVAAFRGTEPEDPSDLFADANFILADWHDPAGHRLGRVHQGFAPLARNEAVFRELKAHLDTLPPAMRVLLTGHSLGAALATLMASWTPRAALYTFGSPRVGDAGFARALTNPISVRVVNCCDLVTRVPPATPFGYEHVGRLIYINRHGDTQDAPGANSIRTDRATAATQYMVRHALLRGTVFSRDLADHAPINYISGMMGLRARE
jgi:dienelactone hydrolase